MAALRIREGEPLIPAGIPQLERARLERRPCGLSPINEEVRVFGMYSTAPHVLTVLL